MKKRMSVYDFCETFMNNGNRVNIEYICSEEPIYQGTVADLFDTVDADLRTVCENTSVKKAIPSLFLSKGLPLSITLLI